jgi:uncharacterized membrane protein
VVQTYFNPGAAGQLRRYCAASCVGVGVLLPLAAPLLALCLINPWIKLLFEVSTVITPASACFSGGAAAVCPGASAVAYYFWNVTNARQARAGARRRPASQARGCLPALVHQPSPDGVLSVASTEQAPHACARFC